MEDHPIVAIEIPRIAPPRMHARKPSRSPTRSRLGDDLLADLSPATTLEAFTCPSGKLKASIEAATPLERAFGLRAALASKKIQEWVTELSEWSWPAEGGSVGFEVSTAKRRKLLNSTPGSQNTRNGFEQCAGQHDNQPQYIGSLLAAEVDIYEERVEEITDEMDDLNVEDIKRQVLDTHFSPRSRPSSSASTAPAMPSLFASYTKMDDFTAVVTATVLQALPNLSQLMRLMDVWTIRLRILRKVPPLLMALEDAEIALRSGWSVIENPAQYGESALEEEFVSRHTFSAMMEVLQRKVTDLGKDLDYMLDILEGKEDTLPNDWLDRMDLIEKDYGEWAVAGDRKVWEGEWATSEKMRKEEEARKLKKEHLAEVEAEQDALEHTRLQALRDAEKAEAARLDAVAKDIARVEAEKEASRLEALRLTKIAENARIEAEKEAQDLARRQAGERALDNSTMEAAKEVEVAEAAKVEAAGFEAARMETEQKAEALCEIAEEKTLELSKLEAIRIVELARIESAKIEAEQKAKIEAQRRATELEASEMAKLEALQIAHFAKIDSARVEAEKAVQELARRNAEEENISILRISQETEIVEAARIRAERQALDLARQQAEVEALNVLRAQAAEVAAAIKSKTEREAQALAARNISDEILWTAGLIHLRDTKEAEAARVIALQELEESFQRKAGLEFETRDVDEIAFQKATEDSSEAAHLTTRQETKLAELKGESHDQALQNVQNKEFCRVRTEKETGTLGSRVDDDVQKVFQDASATTDAQKDAEQVSKLASQAPQKIPKETYHDELSRQDATSVSGDDTRQEPTPESLINNITFRRNAVISPSNKSVPPASMGAVPGTVAVGLGISALAFLHKSEQEPSSVGSKQINPLPNGYSDLDGAGDELFHLLENPAYDVSRISHHSLDMPQEMIMDSGISSPIKFDAVEPQTPALGSPIHFGEHFNVPRGMPSKTPFSSQHHQAFLTSPTTPKSLSLSRPSLWSDNVNSPVASSPDSTATPKSPKSFDVVSNYDGAADTAGFAASSAGTGWVVVNPADATEHSGAASMTSSQESDPYGQSTVSTASATQAGDVDSLVTPTKYSHTFLEHLEEVEDVSCILSPVVEEELMPSIEIDFLDGTCEACDSFTRSGDEDSPPARKRTISVGRFDSDMRRSSKTHRDSVSPNTSTVIDARLSEDAASRVGSPQIDSSFLDSLPEDVEQSPSGGRFGYRHQEFFEYSPPPSPSATPRLAKQRSSQVLKTPGYGFGDFTAPATPLDAPAFDNINVTATPINTDSEESGNDDQLRQQISSLLETIPAQIRLSSEQDNTPSAAQAMRIRKTRRSVTPSIRPSSSMSNYGTSSRAVTPSFTLAPVFSKTTQRSRGSIGNPEIKLYHLSRSTGEPPIKLFVRLVGEHGERVMVRVGGGWADLGEYLKEYASHHGRRSTLEGGEKIETQDLPSRIASGSSISSSITMRNTGRSTSFSRPASVMGSRPGSSLELRKTRRSVSTTDSTKLPSRFSNIRNEDKSPATPLPSTKTRVYGTPPSAASVASSNASGTGQSVASGHSSRLTWGEEDSSLGLAGPKAKKVLISERDHQWVDSMKEKVKLASAEKERRTRERERLDREHLEREQERRTSFGEIDRAAGIKKLFRKNLGNKVVVHKDEKGKVNGL